MPIVADAAAHAVIARPEVEDPRVVRVRVERTRPVATDAACVVETAIVAVARSGQEETVAVTRSEEPSAHAVLCCPSVSRVLVQFLPFFLGGHAPICAPVGRSSIILGQQGSQVVSEAVVAVTGVAAIFGQRVIAAVAVLVGAPIVGVFGLRLTPGKVVAIIFRGISTHIAGGP